MQVGIEEIIKILLNKKDYKEPNTYYYSQITVASASLINTSKSLSKTKFIFKYKVQMGKKLATLKIAKYRI